MQPRHVSLARAVSGRMAIEAARVGQHFAELGEIGGRPRLLVADRRKAVDAGEAARRGVRNRLGGERGRRDRTARIKSGIRKSSFIFSCFAGIAPGPPGSRRAPPHDI